MYDVDHARPANAGQATLAGLRHARSEAGQRARGAAPEIAALRQRAEEIRATTLVRAAGKLSRLSQEERRAIEMITQQLVNELLHLPTVRVNEAADGGRCAAALRHLFALGEVA